jgi:hypothetical protein
MNFRIDLKNEKTRKYMGYMAGLALIMQASAFVLFPLFIGQERIISSYNKRRSYLLRDLKIYKTIPSINCSPLEGRINKNTSGNLIMYTDYAGIMQTVAYSIGFGLSYDLGKWHCGLVPCGSKNYEYTNLFFNKGIANFAVVAKRFDNRGTTETEKKLKKMCKEKVWNSGLMFHRGAKKDLFLEKELYQDMLSKDKEYAYKMVDRLDKAFEDLLYYRFYFIIIILIHAIVLLLGYPSMIYLITDHFKKSKINQSK